MTVCSTLPDSTRPIEIRSTKPSAFSSSILHKEISHEVSTGYCTDRCWAGSYSLVQPSKGIANAGRTAGFTGSLELRDDHAVGKAGRTRWERIFYAERSGRVRAADTQTQQHGPA